MNNKCFVIQRFDKGRYDQLYEQIFKVAIAKAGFTPYRVDQDPAVSIPIESIEREIAEASACFVELSEDAPNIWFELGYAIAKDKPLCLVCSSVRDKFPFDVQHRNIIHYSDKPLPTEYEELRGRIEDRLKALLSKDVALQQNSEAARALSIAPSTNGLNGHELIALTILFQDGPNSETTMGNLKNEMERSGYVAVAAGLAVSGLKRKGFVELVQAKDDFGNSYWVYRVTQPGEDWLLEHQSDLNLRIERSSSSARAIVDDDIPF